MHSLIKLLRPHQYLKNGFVLIGPLFAHQWDVWTLVDSGIVVFAFCAAASSVYIMNDLVDIEADKAHPTKCKRPLASGDISRGSATSVLVILFSIAMLCSLLVSVWVLFFILGYFVLNILYSWHLKHIVILDVFIISSGFMLRILSGTIGLGIAPSSWLLLCGLMVTLFLGFSKRRAELLMLENAGYSGDRLITRRVLDDYSPAMLEQFIAITAACTVLSYGLYTVSPQTVELHGSDNLIYTLPFVIYGIFRYLFLLHSHEKGNDAAKDLITDKHLLLTSAGWTASVVGVLA